MADTHPIRFRGIDHVVLRVSDIARSLRFYVDVLGLALERIIDDLQIYQLRCGRNLIDLTAAPGSSFAAPDAREMLGADVVMAAPPSPAEYAAAVAPVIITIIEKTSSEEKFNDA